MKATLRYFGYYLRQSRGAMLGLLIVAVMLLLVVLAPLVATHDPRQANPKDFLQPPSRDHWFGTDASGLDIYSRVLFAPRIDMVIAVAGVLLSVLIGCPLGVFVGYYPSGFLSSLIMRVMDFLQSLPIFIMAMALVAALGQDITNVIYVLTVFNVPVFVRLMRSEALSLREIEYIEAARCAGNSDRRIIFRHLLPNALAPIIVAATFGMAGAILVEAGLSFLGLGVQPPTASWGNMLNDAQSLPILESMPWLWLPPGVMIALAVLSINFIGDGLRDAFDPHHVR